MNFTSFADLVDPPDKKTTGIVQVVQRTHDDDSAEPELDALSKLKRFEPLGKQISKNGTPPFSLPVLLLSPSSKDLETTTPQSNVSEHIAQLSRRCQKHIRGCADVVIADQRVVEENVTRFDEYCAKLTNSLAARAQTCHQHQEQLESIANIRKNALTVSHRLTDIAKTIAKLEDLHPLLSEKTTLAPASSQSGPSTAQILTAVVTLGVVRGNQRGTSVDSDEFVSLRSESGKTMFPALSKLVEERGGN
ncbi:hypothetical protein BJ742DRAFT_767017 [Cladochytrium replicatum]|nr:hypothetical protein BJ742DRAFT_767017 [Cladochytrium replicatum]